MPNQTVKIGLKAKKMKLPNCPEQNYFGTNYYYYFHLPIGPFHCAKLKKKIYSRVMRMYHFRAQNGLFAPNIFFGKIINIIFILLAPFIVQNFKKILQRVVRMWNFCAQNG